MDITQAIWLALLQGITEFLPISSSAHLILLPIIADWEDQGLAFDVAVHIGTLAAVLWYFRRTLWGMTQDWSQSLRQRQVVGESRLAWAVILGTIPVGLAGLLLSGVISSHARDPLLIATTTLGFGLLLGFADWRGSQQRSEHQLTWKDVAIIGFAQVVALIPGTSRSGITITAGLLLGLNRQAAARFSFLLSIPVIVLAGGYEMLGLLKSPVTVAWSTIGVGVVLSGLSAYACIALFLKMLGQMGLWPFVLYRLMLGTLLLVWFW